MKKCNNCGKDFIPKRTDKPGTYCSALCRIAAKKRQYAAYVQAHRDRKK